MPDTFTGKLLRAAIYLRVSTKDQLTENQERELRRWAERLGLEILSVYSDTASGARRDRAELAALLEAARHREFDTLLVWSIDRLSREGIAPTLRYLEQLRDAGVRVLSHQESWLDTGTESPMWEMFVAVSALWAKLERGRISERVRAGQARARAAGVRFGRPRREVDVIEVHRRREAGQSWRRIAKALKIPARTLRSYAKPGEKSRANSAPGLPCNHTPIAHSIAPGGTGEGLAAC